MTTTRYDPLLAEVRSAVDAVLTDFLATKERLAVTPQTPLFVDWLRTYLANGKRLRPVLCYSGWYAAGGDDNPADVFQIAASLELFHAFALLHDDFMDASDTRRGRPTVHRQIATAYSTRADSERFGGNVAILLGDLTLCWSYELARAAGLEPAKAAAVWPLLEAMHAETVSGQFLDLLTTGVLDSDMGSALEVAKYKTSKYTIERPLQLGSTLAGAAPEVHDIWTAYSAPLGEAFQFRDDLLGVFANPADTGKPAIDDLREGKHTALLAVAWRRADDAQRRRLRALVGNASLDEAGAAEVRRILTVTGARATIEKMIDERCEQAMTVLRSANFPADRVTVLHQLARYATERGH
ncbi:polyprenyl synthetase family protein [Kutzneria buriramensis]|uniref:Geranylgeranyl diphosphate synthase type I n=1 Tax=Kutzneria buriramensis TaxID=1045776 RepID=A0A3E0G5X7_9PSEU|nr:polyprenyl synthetase family protein [Kutzneria buriramensis]REH17863.1 geranylgeranyl diphosphate synthase type I [Kutzneria buriramensis]